MNKITAIITKIIENPYFAYSRWWVSVEYNAYGKL
jgi:hypothetical protein